MPSERHASMMPAPAEDYETLLREARDTTDRLQLILDINNTIVANLELQDLLHAVAASLRRALGCDAGGIFLADTPGGSLRDHAFDFPGSIRGGRPGCVSARVGARVGVGVRNAQQPLDSP